MVYRCIFSMIIKTLFKNRFREFFRIFIISIVASKINLFSSKKESPYKSISFLLSSDLNSKLLQIDFSLLVRSIRWWWKWWQDKRQCVVSSFSMLKEYSGLESPWKLCLNLCSFRWLKPNLKLVRNLSPFGSKTLYILFWIGRMKDNKLLLSIEIDSEFLKLPSELNQSFKVEEKKEYLNNLFYSCNLVYGCSWF